MCSLHRLHGRPHSSIGSHSLACWSNQLQNSIVAAAELQLSAYMHRKASSAVTWPLDSRPPSHFTTPLPTATRVPDEERSIERRTRRGGRERGEREERREGLCSIGYSFRYAHYYIIGPPPLRGSFFLENGTLRDTREKNPEIGSKNLTDPFTILVNRTQK
mgnify:CR=1 FL=1